MLIQRQIDYAVQGKESPEVCQTTKLQRESDTASANHLIEKVLANISRDMNLKMCLILSDLLRCIASTV